MIEVFVVLHQLPGCGEVAGRAYIHPRAVDRACHHLEAVVYGFLYQVGGIGASIGESVQQAVADDVDAGVGEM